MADGDLSTILNWLKFDLITHNLVPRTKGTTASVTVLAEILETHRVEHCLGHVPIIPRRVSLALKNASNLRPIEREELTEVVHAYSEHHGLRLRSGKKPTVMGNPAEENVHASKPTFEQPADLTQANRGLAGKWTGELIPDLKQYERLRVTLLVVECLNQELDALLYYEGRRHGHQNDPIFKGLDQIIPELPVFVKGGTGWSARFRTALHVPERDPGEYDWDCRITRTEGLGPMLDVTIRKETDPPGVWSGSLYKK